MRPHLHARAGTAPPQLRAYFTGLMTPDVRAALTAAEGEYGDGEAYRQVVRQLGRDGWLALAGRASTGAAARPRWTSSSSPTRRPPPGCPVPFLTINTVGPTIMRYGTAEQKADYLPRIAAGEIHFSIGYSEPEAGTDLARCAPAPSGTGSGDYVINGQKMWTSLIQYADYVWLACRTDPEAPRHKGLSILIVPTAAARLLLDAGAHHGRAHHERDLLLRRPGARLRPGRRREPGLAADHQPAQPRAGGPHLGRPGPNRRCARSASGPATTKLAGGQRVIDAEWVQLILARVHAKTEFLKLLNWRIATQAERARPGGGLGHQGVRHRVRHRGVPAADGGARRERPGPRRAAGAVLAGRIERMHRSALILTFGGGTNEVQRDIIAAAALGLPAARR